ncbi:MAG: Cystathionine beta-lyase [Phycisphaerae bacterium]|nr:Cystathionine beta-lyase [Phycisphaerae bacterium]
MRFATRTIHAAQPSEPGTGALVAPIFQTSTFEQEAPGVHHGFDYSRTNNPTRQRLEEVLADLEGVRHCALFASGLAAENAVLQALVGPGDTVITPPDVYGGTFRLLNRVYRPRGVRVQTVDLSDTAALAAALSEAGQAGTIGPSAESDDPATDVAGDRAAHAGRSDHAGRAFGIFDESGRRTRIVWLESPTNPRLLIYDIRAICRVAHQHGALVVVDNTFATPVFQRPFELGADIVIHSVTKYLAGHSDLIQGAALARDKALFEPIKFLQNATGAVPAPFDCWLTLRGIKTLELRVRRHAENAAAIAAALDGHPAVRRVYYPGLPSHPGHAIARRQMDGFGGMVSIELNADIDAVREFVSSRRYFALGESLGGVKSLICHPAAMTHASIPAEIRAAQGLSDSLVRLSPGIEDAADLVDDLVSGLIALVSRSATRRTVRNTVLA